MSVSLLVGLLPYWNYTNVGISFVLDEISLWNFLETFLVCWQANSKWFWNSFMSLSLLVGLLPYWNYSNIGISPVLEEISFWNFMETFLGWSYNSFLCQSVSWLTSLLILEKYRDFFSLGWYSFLKFYGDFPGMLVY